jgi:hypothetical protein
MALICSTVAFAGLNTAWAQDTGGEPMPAACISTDPAVSDSAAWAISAVSLFEQQQYVEAVNTVNACFSYWGPDGGLEQKKMWDSGTNCPRTGGVNKKQKRKIDKNGLLNDVSLALWAKARSLHELDQIEAAKKAYAQCIYMACGRAWDPQGWYWSPAEDCAKQAGEFIDKESAGEG